MYITTANNRHLQNMPPKQRGPTAYNTAKYVILFKGLLLRRQDMMIKKVTANKTLTRRMSLGQSWRGCHTRSPRCDGPLLSPQ